MIQNDSTDLRKNDRGTMIFKNDMSTFFDITN